MDFLYFPSLFAIRIHEGIIQKSGGLLGIKDKGLIESILAHLQNPNYYKNMEEKLTHLVFSFNKNHCFVDGNKRSSIALGAYFLLLNKRSALVNRFIIEMENIAVDIAEGKIDKKLLLAIISSLLYEIDYSEELKLAIIHAKT